MVKDKPYATRQLGPFDNRFKRKRCAACVKAHTKCDGRVPCGQCLFAGRTCIPATPNRRQIEFEAVAVPSKHQFLVLKNVPTGLVPEWTDHCVTQFFTSFLHQHDFIGRVLGVHEDVRQLMGTSPCLQNTILALGSFHIERQQPAVAKAHETRALEYYQNAITLLRSQLNSELHRNQANDELLWSTLLLGVFELMYDPTGEGFLCHFIQGTLALLRTKNPQKYVRNGGLHIFRLARLFELVRSVAFMNTSFFEQPEWQAAIDLLDDHETNHEDSSHAEILFEDVSRLVEHTTKLNAQLIAITPKISPEDLTLEQSLELAQLARDGMSIRQSLELWQLKLLRPSAGSSSAFKDTATSSDSNCSSDSECSRTAGDSEDTMPKRPWPFRRRVDSQLLLSQIYYHAISMNLSTMFDRAPHFPYLGLDAPTISPAAVQKHMMCILNMAECALKHTNMAGILILWPLRTVGARATGTDQVVRVQAMFDEIEKRGFTVTGRYRKDCVQRWWVPKGLIESG